MSDKARQEFEKWISSQLSTERYFAGWTGHYKDYCVQLAWEAWQEAWNRRAGEGVEVLEDE